MNDFVPRIDGNAAADRAAAVRIVPPVAPVAAGGGSETAAGQQGGSDGGNGSGADAGSEARRQLLASMADYSRIQSRIARILVSMHQGGEEAGVQAAAVLDSMASSSGIVVPLPPTTLDALEMAERTARSLVRQAGLGRRAQANVAADTVTQILSTEG